MSIVDISKLNLLITISKRQKPDIERGTILYFHAEIGGASLFFHLSCKMTVWSERIPI
jgi:hypothetical protein